MTWWCWLVHRWRHWETFGCVRWGIWCHKCARYVKTYDQTVK